MLTFKHYIIYQISCIETGIITYKVRKNSTKFDINGMTIENLEW